MSYIPAKKMPHAHAPEEAGTGGGELGGVPDTAVVRSRALGWVLGAAGAGLVAVTVAGLLSLRGSSHKPAPKRAGRPRKAKGVAAKPRAKKAAA